MKQTKNNYQQNNKKFYKNIAVATLIKVYSKTVYPRVLTNYIDKSMQKLFKNRVFCYKYSGLQKYFAKHVHINKYDIGLYFYKNKNNIYCKVYNGNGQIYDNTIKSVFDNIIFRNYKNYKKNKKNIKRQYKKTDKTKLLYYTKK